MKLKDAIELLSTKQIRRIKNTGKEYVIFRISVFNAGVTVRLICTNTYKDICNSRTYNGYDFIADSSMLRDELEDKQAIGRTFKYDGSTFNIEKCSGEPCASCSFTKDNHASEFASICSNKHVL